MEEKNIGKFIRNCLMVILGNFIYAAAVKFFLMPGGLISGGSIGIALTVNHFTGLPVSKFILIFNIVMLLVGLAFLGKAFAATTVLSSFVYPLSLDLLDALFPGAIITDNVLLCMIFSGLGIGVAITIVIRAGASTGGMDIPPLILNKYFKLPVSAGLYIFDTAILVCQFFFTDNERILYGILLVLVYTIVIDKLMFMGNTQIEVKIVSKKSEQIRQGILKSIDRGVTVFYGEGGYLREGTNILFSVISNRELSKVEKLVHSIDPECFMVINHVNEVSGRGFSMKKIWGDKDEGTENN